MYCGRRHGLRGEDEHQADGEQLAHRGFHHFSLLWVSRRRWQSRDGGQRLPMAGTRAKLYTRVRGHVVGWTRTRGIFHSLMIRDVGEAEYGGQLARRCRGPGGGRAARVSSFASVSALRGDRLDRLHRCRRGYVEM